MYFKLNYPNVTSCIISSLALALLVLTYYGYLTYIGSKWVYLIFTFVSHSLLILGLTSKALFFDFFIGLFFWLGFWLKFTVKLIFYNAIFSEPIGYFEGSSSSYNHALMVATVGMSGLLVATLIRRKFFKDYFKNQTRLTTGLELIYQKNRIKILSVFFAIIILVGVTNFNFGIYQKGTITQTFLPFGLNNIYKWLLIFGMTSISALILDLEFKVKKNISLISFAISIFETFFTSISMLSRGMILNSSSIILGIFRLYNSKKQQISPKYLFAGCLIFLIFFLVSQQAVGTFRTNLFKNDPLNISISETNKFTELNHIAGNIFIDRWVGMEGVMSVVSYPHLSAKLFKDALNEKYVEDDTSFYDKYILTDKSPYVNVDKSKHHFLSLPGIIAFLYYTGSYLFLFIVMCFIGGLSAGLEVVSYKLTGNLILVSLISQVVAYRLSNFGYVASQSYLLFGTIILNIVLVNLLYKILEFFPQKNHIS
jgi:hypothetical protein